MKRWWTRPLGLALGWCVDQVVGDPRKGHPVAAFGNWSAAVERRWWADSRQAGVRHLAATVAPVIATALLVDRRGRRHALVDVVGTAAVTWVCLGGRSLHSEGQRMAALLTSGQVEAARNRLSHLCARQAEGLGPDELARATVESLAENTSDAVVGTLVWGTISGIPGMVLHRAANTLDAMVGYRSERYHRFGWAAARLDDVLNLVPARLTGVLVCLVAPLADGSQQQAWRIMLRDRRKHPSPNGGWCEAAVAGALGRRLGGTNDYGDYHDDRPTLGDGPAPDVDDVKRTVRLTQLTGWAALALSLTVTSLRRNRR